MNTLNFLDANVGLALLWNRHLHSEQAVSWFEQANDGQFFFCRFTQITILRLLTTETKSWNRHAVHVAWNVWDRLWADDRSSFFLSQMILSGSYACARGYTALLPESGPGPVCWRSPPLRISNS